MFKSMSMNTKLMIPTVLLCFVTAFVGWVGYSTMKHVGTSYNRVTDEIMPDIESGQEMFLAFRQIRISLRTLGLPGISKDDADAAVKDTQEEISNFEKFMKSYEDNNKNLTGEEAVLWDKVQEAWKTFKGTGVRVLELQKRGTDEDKRKMVEIFFKDCPHDAAIFRTAIINFTEFQKKQGKNLAAAADSEEASGSRELVIVLLVGIAVGVAAAIASARSASNLVKNISAVADNLAQGADQVSGVAGQVASASQTLSASSTQQAAAIQETTAAVEETSAMVAKNADNAKRSSEIAERSQETANRGKTAVAEVLTSIDEIARSNGDIAQQIDESNREMADVVKVIQEIGTKTKVINDIVFQTKLLSFNASVEAARAGEQGKGFAVVAEEVGNLAQMSGNSAKEITELLDVSTKKVQEMVAKTKTKVDRLIAESQEKVRRGTETAKRCDTVLNEIVTDVSSVGGLVAEIATASQEQANGVAEVNKAITELDSAAQQNSQASAQASTSADELNAQVDSLRKLIVDLNSLVRGSSAQTPSGSGGYHGPSNVIPMQRQTAAPAPRPRTAVAKKAAGDAGIPSRDNPGFVEV